MGKLCGAKPDFNFERREAYPFFGRRFVATLGCSKTLAGRQRFPRILWQQRADQSCHPAIWPTRSFHKPAYAKDWRSDFGTCLWNGLYLRSESVEKVNPYDSTILEHQEQPWLTLFTCVDYNDKALTYLRRLVIKAKLVDTMVDTYQLPGR